MYKSWICFMCYILKQSADSAKLAYHQKMRQLTVSTIKLDTEMKRKE
jgi:hypothetical protein